MGGTVARTAVGCRRNPQDPQRDRTARSRPGSPSTDCSRPLDLSDGSSRIEHMFDSISDSDSLGASPLDPVAWIELLAGHDGRDLTDAQRIDLIRDLESLKG